MLARLLSALLLVTPALAAPPSPEEHLGRPVGTDFELADWAEVSSYYERLAAESPNVLVEKVGVSTEGRDMLLAVISSEGNLARLDQWKEHARVIADPRGRSDEEKRAAVEEGRLILLVSPQMHSTETAGTEAAMQFSWLLATSQEEPWASARENLVVGVFACTNPDGLDDVVHWYREHVGTPYEATGMLELYQKYTGHDNNRDWFMLSQQETRVVSEQIYRVWRPQVYWDIHQQGTRSERFFTPPYRDPLNPNLDAGVITGIDALGSRALHDMTAAGFTGISTMVTYDMWWNGGNRSTPARHNILGLLTEAASVDIATPLFLRPSDLRSPVDGAAYEPSVRFPAPWPGGWWRLSDIVEYQVAFGKSIMGSLSRERAFWLRNSLEASERAIARGVAEGPRAWLIPSDNRDPDAVRRLADSLLRQGVEMHVAREALVADGREYPAGSLVILGGQPSSAQVKDLFEVQRYPQGDPPYDVAGWTLPLLLGVHRVEVMESLDDAALAPAATVDQATAAFASSDWPAPAAHSSAWKKAFDRLEGGTPIALVTKGEQAGMLANAATVAVEDALVVDVLPRIGLYAPWFGSMDEGWTRWVLDEWGVPYSRVRNEQLRAGRLADFLDVLVIPDIGGSTLDDGRSRWSIANEHAGGLAPEGAAAIEEFVRGGGRLVTMGSSSDWAIELLRLPVVNAARGDEAEDFSCPGSVLRAIPEDAAINAGLADSVALFFSRSGAFRDMTKDEREEARVDEGNVTTLLRLAPSRVLLSGWIKGESAIEGRGAWLHASHGKGSVHLFGFRPQYRAWSQGTFPLLFRAMLLDVEATEEEKTE